MGGWEPSSSLGVGLNPAQEEANPAVLSNSAFPGAERRAGQEGLPQTTVAAFYAAKYVALAAAEIRMGPQSICSAGTRQPLQRCPGNTYR